MLQAIHRLSPREVPEAIDEIARLNARRVEESALGVERSLRATLIGAGIVTLLGVAAALLLLRYALRGMSSHQDLWRAHTAEVDAFAARAAQARWHGGTG